LSTFWEEGAVQLESDEEVLCRDVAVGKVGRRCLSLDVSFFHRDTCEWGGVVKSRLADFVVHGVFLELGVQGIVRPDVVRLKPTAPRPRARAYWAGMHWWNTPRWDTSRMIVADGVQLEDLTRLHDLAAAYCHSMVVVPGTEVRAVFMERGHELEIRQIAERLNATVS
jgi:hypothetical protein